MTFVAVKMQDDFRSVVMSKENVSHSSSQSSLWTSMVAENHHVSHISTVPEHYSHRETMIMIEVLLVHTGRKQIQHKHIHPLYPHPSISSPTTPTSPALLSPPAFHHNHNHQVEPLPSTHVPPTPTDPSSTSTPKYAPKFVSAGQAKEAFL